MNMLESTLTCIIIALLLVVLGLGCKIEDQSNAILKQRVQLLKHCIQDYGVDNCTF